MLFSAFLICTSPHVSAFAPGGPASTPRTIIKLKHHPHIFYDDPITYGLFFTTMMLEKGTISQDVRNKILQYCIYLKQKDFLEKFPHQKEWADHNIPIKYEYFLSSQQLNTLGNVFINGQKEIFRYIRSKSNNYKTCDVYSYNIYYRLQSEKDYKLFLQLPIEVRICLTKLPTSYNHIKINKKTEILVLNKHRTEYDKKPMLPTKKKPRLLTFKKHKNSKK